MNEVLIAAGPWVKAALTLPLRIVLRAILNEEGTASHFVVHAQLNQDGMLAYHQGSYFLATEKDAFRQAYNRFVERCASTYYAVYEPIFNERGDYAPQKEGRSS